MERQYRGFTPDDFYSKERSDYDPELVQERETGGYETIVDMTLDLFEENAVFESGSNGGAMYTSEKDGSHSTREFVRVDSESFGDTGTFINTQTELVICYESSNARPIREGLTIEVRKSLYENPNTQANSATVYCIERVSGSTQVDASTTYRDVVYDEYYTRRMTPYDEDQLAKELIAMHEFITVQQDENLLIEKVQRDESTLI
jgi:hypothetical protein